jgi:DNA repair exonuclease SbcCD ATPase subunit
MGPLIELRIVNFQGVASFVASPDGKSMELRGDNGRGKSSVINALAWGLGFNPAEEIIRNGTDESHTEIAIGEYIAIRKWKRGKKPTLNIKLASNKAPLGSSPALLRGFLEQIERNTFSTRKPAEQAAILRKICPGCDTADLDAEHAKRYQERTDINRDAKTLAAQAAGIVVPDAPANVPADVDLVEIAEKKTVAEKERAAQGKSITYRDAWKIEVQRCKNEIERLKCELKKSEQSLLHSTLQLEEADKIVNELKPIDTSTIDEEIRQAKITNAERLEQRQAHNDTKFKREQREHLQKQVRAKEKASERITERLAEIEAEKAEQLAAAKLPIEGLAIAGDVVTLYGVEVSCLDNFPRMSLDVRLAAAQGHRIAIVRDAILLNSQHRAELERIASGQSLQLIVEVVCEGQSLSAEIVEGGDE